MKQKLLILILLSLLVALPSYAQNIEDCQTEAPVEDFNTVVEACTEWLEAEPLNRDAYFFRAYALTELGSYEASIIDYSKYLFIDPKNAIAYNNRAYAYELSGDMETAILDYSRALLADPSYTQALINRAYAYSNIQDYESATADAQRLAELTPEDSFSYELLGSIALDQNDYAAAADAYTSAIELAPAEANGYLGRGFAFWSAGDYEAAAPDYLAWVNLTAPTSEDVDPADAVEPFTVMLADGTHYRLEIEAEAGQVLSVTAVARQETIDPVLILLDGAGQAITMDDDSGGGLGAVDAVIADYELPDDGSYTLIIGYAGGGSNGGVRVDVRLNDAQ